jgi:hypothetical protein
VTTERFDIRYEGCKADRDLFGSIFVVVFSRRGNVQFPSFCLYTNKFQGIRSVSRGIAS